MRGENINAGVLDDIWVQKIRWTEWSEILNIGTGICQRSAIHYMLNFNQSSCKHVQIMFVFCQNQGEMLFQLTDKALPHATPMGACGGPKCHSIPRKRNSFSFASFHPFTSRFNSLSAPLKFVPLSLTRTRTPGRREWKRINAFKKVVELISCNSSKCTALHERQVNSRIHLLWNPLPPF